MIAQKVLHIVKAAGGMFESTPAPDLGYYMTFLEMLNSTTIDVILRHQMKACRRSQWEDVRFVQHGSFPQ